MLIFSVVHSQEVDEMLQGRMSVEDEEAVQAELAAMEAEQASVTITIIHAVHIMNSCLILVCFGSTRRSFRCPYYQRYQQPDCLPLSSSFEVGKQYPWSMELMI